MTEHILHIDAALLRWALPWLPSANPYDVMPTNVQL